MTDLPTTAPAFGVSGARDIGGAGDQAVLDVVAGPRGAFVAGVWTTTLELHDGHAVGDPDGNIHPFLAATDASGQALWHRGFGASARFTRVAGTAEGDAIVGGSRIAADDLGCGPIAQQGGFLAKYAGDSGACQWMRVWPSSEDYTITAVTTEPDGDLAVAGTFRGLLDLGGGVELESAGPMAQAFVTRTDSRGHAKWAKIFGDPANGETTISAVDLTADEAGNLYLVGSLSGRADLAGQTVDMGPHTPVTYVLALDGEGAARWRYLDALGGLVPTAAQAHAGRLAVVGGFTSPFTFAGQREPAGDKTVFVLDFGLDGRQRWAQTFGGSADQHATDVAVDDADRVNVVGDFSGGAIALGSATFGAGAPGTARGFVAVLDGSDGAVARANALGDDGARFGEPRLAIAGGLRLMGGTFQGTSHFGGVLLGPTAEGSLDGVMMRLSPAGDVAALGLAELLLVPSER